jgi:hypothetical protein
MKTRKLDDPFVQISLLLAVAALFIAINWLKFSSFWMDAPRSLFEMYRAAAGEIPYRDFMFPYPPLAVAMGGLIFHWFGATFLVEQITVDILSLACLVAAWLLARRLAPPFPAFAAAAAFLLLAATSKSFSLFSLDLYTLSFLLGAFGLMLACNGMVIVIREGLKPLAIGFLACGGLLSCLGKPEAAAGLVVALAVLAMADLRVAEKTSRFQALAPVMQIAAWLLLPATATYAVLLTRLGARPVIEGVTAYGLAACPSWWPTGYSLVGVLAALGAAVAGLGVLVAIGSRAAQSPKQRILTLLIASAGFLSWLAYTSIFFRDLIDLQPIRHGVLAVAYFLISGNTVVLPILWASILMLVLEALACWFSGTARTPNDKVYLVVFGVIFGVSIRELFNNIFSQTTQAATMLDAIVFPAFPLLVQRALFWWNTLVRRAPSTVSAQRVYLAATLALSLFAGVRLAGYAVREATKRYVAIDTDAGRVKLGDGGVSAEVYDFLEKNTAPGEPIGDIAYGGGVNFALHRRSPFFTTQFSNFRPTVQNRQRDYLQLLASKTRFVINRNPPAVGYGTGKGCSFPRFVWKASACSECTDATFPVMQLLQQQYRPSKQFGEIVIYERISANVP